MAREPQTASDNEGLHVVDAGSTPARAKYQRVGQLLIRPLLLRQEYSAYDLARLFYAQYPDLNFDDDLNNYYRNGYVISHPYLFTMFKPIMYEGERIWFVRILVGNLIEAIQCMPCQLPAIAFCRNNQPDKMVVCDTERLIKLAMMTIKKEAA